METVNARIPAASKREAMDWSLVLVSQGIESVIDRAHEEPYWGLLVAEADFASAVGMIQQYRHENRHWPWRREVLKRGVLFDWGALPWVILIAVLYWLQGRVDLQSAGIMDSTAVARGEWWRLFTAVWLHGDLAHMGSNATLGLVLLGLAMGAYGTGAGLLAAYLAGAGGNIVAWLLSAGVHRSLGASGMVMGCLGLLAIHSLPLWRQQPRPTKFLFTGIFGGVMLFVLLGLAPGTDIVAHLGGFASGLLIGAVATQIPDLAGRVKTNLFSGFLFALLVIIPWWLALRHALT